MSILPVSGSTSTSQIWQPFGKVEAAPLIDRVAVETVLETGKLLALQRDGQFADR